MGCFTFTVTRPTTTESDLGVAVLLVAVISRFVPQPSPEVATPFWSTLMICGALDAQVTYLVMSLVLGGCEY